MHFPLKLDVRRISWWSTVALALLIAFATCLIEYQGSLASSAGNGRTELQERLGTQAIAASQKLTVPHGTNRIVLAAAAKHTPTYAEWLVSDYEYAHILPRSTNCSLEVYVIGPNVTGSDATSWARIDLNGRLVSTIRFRDTSPDFPITSGQLSPADIAPEHVPITPLFRPYGLVFPVDPAACRATRWDVRITVYGARWPIDRVGVFAHFSPPPPMAYGASSIAASISALLLIGALIVGTHVLFEAVVRRYGPAALSLVLAVFVCALVTHDEWDFFIWLRFVDLLAFGHGNPAYMWAGTPLWPFMTMLAAPVLSAAYATTSDASQEVTALFLKFAMALAMCANALFLAGNAPLRLRRFLFPVFLLSPLGLYELAGGYRELFAGSFVLLGCSLAVRSRYLSAALVFSLGASISESVLPLVFLPACLQLGERSNDRRVWRAAISAGVGIVPIAFQWFFLIPRSVVSAAVGSRLESAYRYGGASWLSTLDGFRLLPASVGRHSLVLVGGIFVALALPLMIRLALEIARDRDFERYERRVFGIFVGLVVAFFLAYRGVDPATWYALFTITAFYFVRFDSTNPFVLFLSTLQGVTFYAILGIGDFANWTYLTPQNRSLLGVLGPPMLVCVLAVNAAICALYLACLTANTALFFRRGSTWFLLLFFGAVANGATFVYPLDILLCFSAATLLLITFERLNRLNRLHEPIREPRNAVVDYVGLICCIVVGVWTGTHDAAAALVAFDALLLGLVFGFGLCDIVLALAGSLLLASQPGFSWVSIAGWIALSLVSVAAIRKAYAAFSGGDRIAGQG